MSGRNSARPLLTLIVAAASLSATLALSVQATTGASNVSLTGVVVHDHGDDFANGRDVDYLTLVTAEDRYSLTGPGKSAAHAGKKVTVSGRLVGGTIYLHSASSVQPAANETFTAAESALVTGQTSTTAVQQSKRVAVLLINFAAAPPPPTPTPSPCLPPTAAPTDSLAPTSDPSPTPTASPFVCPTPPPTPSPTAPPPQPWTTTQVAGYYFNNNKSVASFYRELSNGSMTVTGDVFGWFTLTVSTASCDYNGFATGARAAATAAGVDLAAYTNVAYAMPKVSACSWGGLGEVNGRNSWINGTSAMGVYVPTHELGHNFGSHHASSLTCVNGSGVRVQYSNNCTASEYGDPFDVMGSNASSSGGIHHENTWAMRQIGVLTTADQQTVTASGNYFVATAPVAGGVPRILRVLRPAGDYYYLEFRQPYGTLYENWASSSPAVNGVMIRNAPGTARVQSKLIDCHPETPTFDDAPCLVGDRFVDNPNKITIITRSISSTGANVYVQVGPDVTPPSAPGALTGSWTAPTSVSLSWTAATDEIGVTGYEVRRDSTLLATVSGTTFSYVDTSAPASTQSYTVAGRDAAGNVGPPAMADVGTPDTVPPGAPGTLDVAASGPGTADLTWTPATDDMGVANYDVSVGGVVVATVDSLSYQVTGLTSTDSYSFAVAARDNAGNVGPEAGASMVMPDLVSPGSPSDLAVASVGKTTVSLTWSAATDDVGVAGYEVRRNGVVLATVSATSYNDGSLSPDTGYSYAVVATDAAGNLGPSVTVGTTTLEATPPTVATPGVQLGTTGQLGTSTVPIVVSWQASDASGVASVELQQSKGGGAWSVVSVPLAATSSVTLMRAPGYTYAYRVRATDSLSNTSPWSTGPTMKVVVRQEGNTAITYKGTWTAASISSAYGGAVKYAKGSTASATFKFSGRSVDWIAPMASNRGKAAVYVDGVFQKTIDLYSATSVARSIVFSYSWNVSGTHTLQIKVKATSGRPRVDVDAFVVGAG